MISRIAALFIAVLCIVGAATAQSVGIATNAGGGMYYSSGTALAKVANDKANIRATIQPFAGFTVYAPAVNSGDPQFGFGNAYELSLALEGIEHFAGRPNPNLRAVAVTFPIRTGMYVRKNSPFRKIVDLKGRSVPDGYMGQKVVISVCESIYATAGLTRGDFRPVNVPHGNAGADAFAAGKADMFVFAMGGAKIREVDASVGGIRSLSIDNTPANLAAVRKHLPTGYLRLEKPGVDNPGITEPVYVVAYDSLLFTSAAVPDELVYKITKIMYENKADLTAIFPTFELFEPQEMAKKIPVPYHPGAIKFYQEKGMWPPK